MEHARGTGTRLGTKGQIFSHNPQTSLGPPVKQSTGQCDKFTQPPLREADAENREITGKELFTLAFLPAFVRTYVNYMQSALYLEIKIL